jgi:hypothetical protein
VNAVAIPAMLWLTSSGGPTNETTFILLCSLTALYAVGHLALAIVTIFAECAHPPSSSASRTNDRPARRCPPSSSAGPARARLRRQ